MTDYAAKLQSVLDGLGESSRFVAVGRVPPVLPGLDVKGVGLVGTPVTAADAKRLIQKASPAPYGRGEETLVDTSVRRVWQIEPSKFNLRNLDWNAFLAGIVDAVKQEFGIGQQVEHQLYKLLVYEKGSFFAPHRDSEKAPGMFATLVVCLPSAHEGGKLVVRHDGQTVAVDFSGPDAEFKVQYVAFYADCEHEILPVTKGYRVCLVYNLALAGRKRQPRAPQNSPRVESVAGLLPGLFADGARNKIAVPLEHQYTLAGLDPRELKGADRARLDILVQAAEKLDYQVFLAFLTHSQSGEVDYSSWDRGYRRGRYYDSDDEEEDEDEDDAAVMGEVFEEELSLDGWQDANGRQKPFGQMRLEEHEILDDEEARHYEQHVHEATGNEGATLERQYQNAVIVLWPRDRYFRILAAEGSRSSVPALEEMLRSRKSSPDDCQRFAEEIIQHWQGPENHYHPPGSQSALMLKLLSRIGSAELSRRFVDSVLPEDFDGTEGPSLCKVCSQIGWKEMAQPLRKLFASQRPESYRVSLKQIVPLFEALGCNAPAMNDERQAACGALAEEMEQLIDRWVSNRKDGYRRDDDWAGVPEGMIHALSALGDAARLDRFVTHVLADPKRYELHKVLIPAVKAVHAWIDPESPGMPAYERLFQHAIAELRSLTATPVEPPGDWAREADLRCKCADCRELAAFLCDPTAKARRFPLRKDRRQHLHQQIDGQHLDVTHVTERNGSPQTLVCTKTQESYERRLAQYAADLGLLDELEQLARGPQESVVPAPAGKRLKASRSKASVARSRAKS